MTERDIHIVEAPAADLAEGVAITTGGKSVCDVTGAVLREGDTVVVRLTRAPESVHWGFGRVYHPAAAPTDVIHGDASGNTITLYAKGRLAVCSDAATQSATLRLVDAEVVSLLRPGEA
jgi:hypothetical protein